MRIYDLHMNGDCWPDNCPICAQEEDAVDPTACDCGLDTCPVC
jgi:hypothetical protein